MNRNTSGKGMDPKKYDFELKIPETFDLTYSTDSDDMANLWANQHPKKVKRVNELNVRMTTDFTPIGPKIDEILQAVTTGGTRSESGSVESPYKSYHQKNLFDTMSDEEFQKTIKSALKNFFETIKSVYPDN